MRSVVATVLVMGCAKSSTPPEAAPGATVDIVQTGAPWTHPLHADHPLVGRIWSSAEQRFVPEAELLSALRSVDHVLLGEKHDNADHHRLQARLLTALAPPAVAFEHLDHGAPVSEATSPDALAEAVSWAESGWPDFDLYRPVFAATFDAKAQVVPAHPARAVLNQAMQHGLEGLDPTLTEGLSERTLSDSLRADLAEQVVEAHCGHASEPVIEMMLRGQHLKDAWMARALERAGSGTVLIAGNGHTRTDRGVPHYLTASSRTLAFVEVVVGETEAPAYDEPADFLWFTPRVDDDDPCEVFREQLEQMGKTEPDPG